MPQNSTKTRILDSAEHLFACDGFHPTSLRTITGAAKVNLASVNYHFGSKDALLQAVIKRRLLPLNEVREERMAAVMARARQQSVRPDAEKLLRAFIEPTLEFRESSSGYRDFISLVGRSLSEPDKTVRDCFMELALPTFQLLFEGLREALPQLPPTILLTRLQFVMGTMSHVMCIGAIAAFSRPMFPPALGQKAQMEQLMKYVLAGLEAPE